MKPGGTIRPAIEELAKQSGAYIIVSAKGSTSDSATPGAPGGNGRGGLHRLQMPMRWRWIFYDRNRVASWVRNHPGLIPWVRQRIGNKAMIEGWQVIRPLGLSARRRSRGISVLTGVCGSAREEKNESDGIAALAGIETHFETGYAIPAKSSG